MLAAMGTRRTLIAFLMICAGASSAAERSLTYLVLADTVAPLMITKPDDPMSGGIVTEVAKRVFSDSDYAVTPLVVPWQRMTEEMITRGDWVTYGQRSRCEADRGCTRSAAQIVPFEHVVVTLADSALTVQDHKDLFGKDLLLVDNFHYPGLDRYLTTPVDEQGTGAIRDVRAFTPEGALRMLRHRRGDAYIDWRLRVLYNLAGAGLTRSDVRLTGANQIVPAQGIYLIFSDRLPADVRVHIDARLTQMHLDGTIAEIVGRYR